MSIASLNQFKNDVMQDSALQEHFKTVAATSPENLGELAVKLGADRGYNFTLEEIQAAADQELSDAELESVAGGCAHRKPGPSIPRFFGPSFFYPFFGRR